VQLYAFDVLALEGREDLRKLPLHLARIISRGYGAAAGGDIRERVRAG